MKLRHIFVEVKDSVVGKRKYILETAFRHSYSGVFLNILDHVYADEYLA